MAEPAEIEVGKMTEPVKTPVRGAIAALTVFSGSLGVIMLILLVFVSTSDATAVMFVGSATMFSGLFLHSLFTRSSLGAVRQVLLIAADVVLTAVFAILFVVALKA